MCGKRQRRVEDKRELKIAAASECTNAELVCKTGNKGKHALAHQNITFC